MKPCSSSSRRSMCAVRGLAMRRAYCAWLLLWSFMATIYSLDGQQTPQPPFLRTTCPSIGCLSCADDLQPIECDRQNTSTPQFCYGPICDACESGSGEQEFVLMNGSCGCAAGHGLIRQLGPPMTHQAWFARVRRSRFGYMGGKKSGRHLLSSSSSSSSSNVIDLFEEAAHSWPISHAATSQALMNLVNRRLAQLEEEEDNLTDELDTFLIYRASSMDDGSSNSSAPPPPPPRQPPPPPPSPPAGNSSRNLTDRERERLERLKREQEARLNAKRAAEKALAEARMKLQLKQVQRIIARRYQEGVAKSIEAQKLRFRAKQPPYPPFDSKTLLWVPCGRCAPDTIGPPNRKGVKYCISCPPGLVPNQQQSECVKPTIDSGTARANSSLTANSSSKTVADADANAEAEAAANTSSIDATAAAVLIARSSRAFTLAPRSVWVDFQFDGGLEPFVITIITINGTKGPKNGTLGEIQQHRRRAQYTPRYYYCNAPNAADEFWFRVTDATGAVSTAKALVFVDCPDQVYVANDELLIQVGQQVRITVPIVGGGAPFTYTLNRAPTGGSVSDVTLTRWDLSMTYTPRPNYCSLNGIPDYIELQIMERYNTSTRSSIAVEVACPPAPTANPNVVANITQGQAAVIDLQVTGVPPFNMSMLAQPLYGTLTPLTPEGTTTYTPNATYCNSVTGVPELFFYSIYDAFSQYVDAAASVWVACTNTTTATKKKMSGH